MIKNTHELKEQIKARLSRKAEEFVDELSITSTTENFNIDTIEDIMTRFDTEADQIVIDTVNRAISSFDEREIIEKKKQEIKGLLVERKRTKKIMTLNGILSIKRTLLSRTLPGYDEYKAEIAPLDELLQIDILPFKMTKLVMLEVAYMAQMLSSYKEATEELKKKLGYEISWSLVRKVAIFVGNLAYRSDLAKALETEKNMINSVPDVKEKIEADLYILMDGAALNTRVEDKNGSTWRENKLGMSFASINIVKRGTNAKNGYMITKKEYTAFIGTSEDFAKFVYQIACNQGYGKYEQTIVLGDGAGWIRTLCNEKFPDAIQILDFYHLEENIYDFAKYIFKNIEKKYKPWAETIKDYILKQRIDAALREIKKYSKKKLPKGVVNLEKYIKNNIDRINYKEYKENGYFIGSGAIESANKTILQRRLKQSGMRWTVETAQPLLTLRAKVESGLWNEIKQLVISYGK